MTANAHPIPDDFVSAAILLQALIAARKLLKARLDEQSVKAAFALVGATASAGPPAERLQAISLLGKAAEISKPVAEVAIPLMSAALREPLPPTGAWGTADDHYYLAKAVLVGDQPWIASYAASELARADIAERASRSVWAEIAINRAPNLATALNTIGEALADDLRASKHTTDTAARKLNRIASALSEHLSLADVLTGEGFGRSLAALVSEAGGRTGPESKTLRHETALSVLDLMIQVLRLRFEATLDSDVYRAAGTVLQWWKPARAPDIILARSERIVSIAMASLHTLARQGVSQRNLRQALVTAFGAELVGRIGTEFVARDPSLDPAIATWLSSGRELVETRASSSVRDINEHALDELIARLLLTIDNQEAGPQELNLAADAIQLLEPGYAATIRSAATRGRLVAQWAQAIGGKRKLVLAGQRGEIVQYDPALHETQSDFQLGAQVRIRVPGVVRQQEGRPAQAILKGEVEKP
jgi:hypothetical protein